MGKQYSLVHLLSDDSLHKSLKEVKREVRQSQEKLAISAKEYNKKYEKEIEAGTREKQLFLESKGITNFDGKAAEEALKELNKFMPTVQTPILNYLHFLMEEYGHLQPTEEDWQNATQNHPAISRQAKEMIRLAQEEAERNSEHEYNLSTSEIADTDILAAIRDMERQFDDIDNLHDTEYIAGEGDSQGEVPHMEDYIYQNMDSRTFQRIKKLKNLALSSTSPEALEAFRVCMLLCEKYKLDFDKIPHNG